MTQMENIDSDSERKELLEKVSGSDFKLEVLIGRGTQGKVYLVRQKLTGLLYAMKALKKAKVKKLKQIERTKNERNVMTCLDHPFIVQLHWAFQNDKYLCLVSDFCQGGELFWHISKTNGQGLSEEKSKFFVAQIILVFEYLHSKDIIQRDLKPENVLLGTDGYAKVTDFGFIKEDVKQEDAYSFCGTPEQLAPEVIDKIGHGKPVDWWSLGCFTQEIMMGRPAFFNNSKKDLYRSIKNLQFSFIKPISRDANTFIRSLLTVNPTQRLGYNGSLEVKQHPWLKAVNWDILSRKQYRPPFMPEVSSEVDLRYFDDTFTREELRKDSLHAIAQTYSSDSQQEDVEYYEGFD